MSRDGGPPWVLVPLLAKLVATVATLVLISVPGVALPIDDPSEVLAQRTPERTGLVVSQVLGIRAIPVRATPAGGGDRARTAQWDWPLVGAPPVARTFDLPAQRWLPGHRGVDLVGVAGERVLAVDTGVVTFSGEVAGVGVVSVTHESGLRSTYQPVEGRVPRGERVRRGQALGTLDTTASHCVPGACLHLGAVRGRDDYVDPLPLLLGAELSLLPVEP